MSQFLRVTEFIPSPSVLCFQGVNQEIQEHLNHRYFRKRYKQTKMLGKNTMHSCMVLSRNDFKITHHLQLHKSSPVVPVIELRSRRHPTCKPWLIGSFLASDTESIPAEIKILLRELPEENNLTLLGDFCRTVPSGFAIEGAPGQHIFHRPQDELVHINTANINGVMLVNLST